MSPSCGEHKKTIKVSEIINRSLQVFSVHVSYISFHLVLWTVKVDDLSQSQGRS